MVTDWSFLRRYNGLAKSLGRVFKTIKAAAAENALVSENKEQIALLENINAGLSDVTDWARFLALDVLSQEDVNEVWSRHIIADSKQASEEEPGVHELLSSLYKEQRRSEALRAEIERLERELALSNAELVAEKEKTVALVAQ